MTNSSNEVLRLVRSFVGTKYDSLVDEAVDAYNASDEARLNEVVAKIPTDIQLMDMMLEKIKDKSVFKNLKKTLGDKTQNVNDAVIGVSSLITHVVIECKENREFRALLPDLYNKRGELIHHV